MKWIGTDKAFYILIASVDHREIWKYGERGERYTLLDIGHGLGSILIACNAFGWKCQILNQVSSNELQNMFKLPKANYPRVLLKISWNNNDSNDALADVSFNSNMDASNIIHEMYPENGAIWPIIGILSNKALLSSNKLEINSNTMNADVLDKKWLTCNINNNDCKYDYKTCINYALRHRRSALEYYKDKNKQRFSYDEFIGYINILYNPMIPYKYIGLFILYVNYVDNIEPNIYILFPKYASKYETIYNNYLKSMKLNDYIKRLSNNIKLYNCDYFVKQNNPNNVSIPELGYKMACNQNLCRNGGIYPINIFVSVSNILFNMFPIYIINIAFTLDMCIDKEFSFKTGLTYCMSHYQCGLTGQLLYIHSELTNNGSTGIGCYLDDLSLKYPGFNDINNPLNNMRSLYHFSVGKPIIDNRYPYFFMGIIHDEHSNKIIYYINKQIHT